MKKLLLFLLLSSFAFGQDFKRFKNLDELQKKSVIEEIIASTGKKYLLTESPDKGRALIFSNPEDTSDGKEDNLIIVFSLISEGANAALEIKGTEKWVVESISGKFLSLAPIWKKYVEPKSDIVELSKKDSHHNKTTTLEEQRVEFYKNSNFNNFWTIRF